MASDCFSSSAVLTPETIIYEPGAHPPKSNVGQIKTATCGTSASDLFILFFLVNSEFNCQIWQVCFVILMKFLNVYFVVVIESFLDDMSLGQKQL